jgi:hypothetical protein
MINEKNILKEFKLVFGTKYFVYKSSIIFSNKSYFFLVKDNNKKYLFVLSNQEILNEFDGEIIGTVKIDNNDLTVKKSYLSFKNLKIIQKILPHLCPTVCGLRTSFGTGDRLGIVTPAHIQAFQNKRFFPFLCQQSVRELFKTERSWQQVIGDVIWGIFESGYTGPFGADADHVKEIADLSNAIENGFTMFTIDPSDYILNGVSKLSRNRISEVYNSIPEREEIEKLYLGKKFIINKKILEFDEVSLPVIAASYFEAIKHVVRCYKFIKQKSKNDFDLEVSMDEVENAISPLTHIFIVKELQRNETSFQSLALRFTGEWQKALDYIGDLKAFLEDIKMHAEIAKKFGGYKLSLHSGSEKFSVYKIFSEETKGLYHIKTSGTSWLESIRAVAVKNPGLFNEIYNYATEKFEDDKKLYGISIGVSSIRSIEMLPEEKFASLLDFPECRQMIHVTFGSILSAMENSKYIFKDRIYKTLFKNETLLYKYVSENIKKHLKLLKT